MNEQALFFAQTMNALMEQYMLIEAHIEDSFFEDDVINRIVSQKPVSAQTYYLWLERKKKQRELIRDTQTHRNKLIDERNAVLDKMKEKAEGFYLPFQVMPYGTPHMIGMSGTFFWYPCEVEED